MTIPEVDSKWGDLGLILKLDPKSLSEIKSKHSSQLRCKREMFRLAIKNGVTWEMLIIALNRIGLVTVAKNVISLFDIRIANVDLSSLVEENLSKVLRIFCFCLYYCLSVNTEFN